MFILPLMQATLPIIMARVGTETVSFPRQEQFCVARMITQVSQNSQELKGWTE